MRLEDLHSMLEEASKNKVRLYFLERIKNQKTGAISYKICKSEISPEIGEELINSAKAQIIKRLNKKPRYIEWEAGINYDIPTIETIKNPSEIPYFDYILSELGNLNMEILDLDQTKNIWGYIVTVNLESKWLIFMRKYTIKKLLKHGKINMMLHRSEGRFSKIEDEVIAIDRTFDVAFVVSPKEKKGIIFDKNKFESLFNLVETYFQKVSENLDTLINKDIIENVQDLLDACVGDLRRIRKLYNIVRDENVMNNVNIEKIKKIVKDYNLGDIEFENNGKIKVTKRNIWTVLKLLNDDYAKSDMTEIKYEIHSKKAIG